MPYRTVPSEVQLRRWEASWQLCRAQISGYQQHLEEQRKIEQLISEDLQRLVAEFLFWDVLKFPKI